MGHQNMEDRQAAGRLLVEEYGWNIPLLHDSMTNSFQCHYYGWPMRVVLIGNGPRKTIEFASGPIKPYQGFLQFQLFRHLQQTLHRKLGINKDSIAICDDLLDFIQHYEF